ncbi:hypothetical protein EVAR_51787_1 [Eumeta japonica]|uniref:Uncharacterized protein n=1 Tax=Eumeta variegata TaxID=151549 RepID=A0A4C1XD53_EUMVA|nr:hypothetical protein EVAR_51787_1 [Eumeta japonica]
MALKSTSPPASAFVVQRSRRRAAVRAGGRPTCFSGWNACPLVVGLVAAPCANAREVVASERIVTMMGVNAVALRARRPAAVALSRNRSGR